MKTSGAIIRQGIVSALSVVFLLSLTGCAVTSPQPAAEIPASSSAAPAGGQAERVEPLSRRVLVDVALDNTLTLRARNSSGEEISLGSGFFIDGGHVVTNAHVVADAAWVEIFDLQGRLVATAPYALAVDIDNDLAVLPTPHSERAGLGLSEERVQVGEDIWAFGAPLGLEGTTSRGVVSAFREKRGMDLIQITAPISPGSSGGPVLNDTGHVIGIVTLIMTGGQNLNFAVPVRKLRDLQFSVANRESFPAGSVFDEELDEDIAQFIGMMLVMAESPFIEVGRQYRGQLNQGSPSLEGSPYNVYQLEGGAGQRLQIDVMSGQFDTVATLMRKTGLLGDDAWMVEDADSGEGTNSRIVVTLPATDTYYLFVLSYDQSPGAYTVETREVVAGRHERLDPRWQFVIGSTDNARIYVDTQTLSRSGRNVTTWTLMDLEEREQLRSGDYYDTYLSLLEFDCQGRRHRTKAMSYRLQGRLVSSEDVTTFHQRWGSIAPDTVVESLLQHVCAR